MLPNRPPAAVTLTGAPTVPNATVDATRKIIAQLLSDYLGYPVNASRVVITPVPNTFTADANAAAGRRRGLAASATAPQPLPAKRTASSGATIALAISVAGFGGDEPALRVALAALQNITAEGSTLEDAIAECAIFPLPAVVVFSCHACATDSTRVARSLPVRLAR